MKTMDLFEECASDTNGIDLHVHKVLKCSMADLTHHAALGKKYIFAAILGLMLIITSGSKDLFLALENGALKRIQKKLDLS